MSSVSNGWETNHDVKSPWGFSLNEAFEVFKFRQSVLGNDSAFNEYNPDRRKLDLTLFSRSYVCEYPSCGDQKQGIGKWCVHHNGKLSQLRKKREDEKRRRWQERQDILNREKQEEWKRIRRADRLKNIDRYIRDLEIRELKPIKKANLEEYKQYKREVRASQKAARDALKESTRKPRYTGPPRKGFVYRIYDPEDVLLYVGKTFNVQSRLFGRDGHASTKIWWEVAYKVKVTEYKTEPDALLAEAFAIRREKPKFNIATPIPKGKRSPRKLTEHMNFISDGSLTTVLV